MRYIPLLFLPILLPANAVTYIELEGNVTNIVDNTPDQSFYKKLSDGRSHHIIEVNNDKNGWWLSNGKIIHQQNTKNQRYYEATYICGNALNKGYLNNEYRTIMDDLYHPGRVKIHVGKSIEIEFNKTNLAQIKIGTQAKSTEINKSKNMPQSIVEADLVVVKISDENPCE
ncbi:hypothetical protein [Aeromonas veronii]|uniref:hypothetical protein n=1 Tax=Aeromonas veronii TaxID=654 RepID=UPI001CD71636|nr:hypothetical protein [Aeromonas veronii]UBR44517.1 hypothetical protein LAG74_15585 [Aeromonas veronii]